MSSNITFSNYGSKIDLSLVSIEGAKLAPPRCWDEFSEAGNDRVKLETQSDELCAWNFSRTPYPTGILFPFLLIKNV